MNWKTLLVYILVFSWLFGMLDWQVVHFTRWENRYLLDWMHNHEKLYSLVVGTIEKIICTPCVALKPLTYQWSMNATASLEEKVAVLHAPTPSLQGFYHLPKRGESWTFVPWISWIWYWLAPSVIWLMIVNKLKERIEEYQ